MKNKKVVYTSLTKGYDNLKQPQTVHPDWDYICFSNDIDNSRIGIWEVRKIPYENASGTRLTRYPKLNPHLVLPEYEYSLWADANLTLTEEIMERADHLIDCGETLAMVPHSDRNCVYEEAKVLTRRLIDESKVYSQTRFLLQEGFPAKQELFVCCCMLRQHTHNQVLAFSELWWDIYSRYSCRDQMAVSYALWKTRLVPVKFWTKDFYYTYVRQHQTVPSYPFPVRCIRFIYSNLLLLRLRILYWHYGISWRS